MTGQATQITRQIKTKAAVTWVAKAATTKTINAETPSALIQMSYFKNS
jgi:hypothetical protein